MRHTSPRAWTRWSAAFATFGFLAGCNMITGADSLVLEKRPGTGTTGAGPTGAGGDDFAVSTSTVGPSGAGGFDATTSTASSTATASQSASSTVGGGATSSSAASTGSGMEDPPGPPPVTNAADGVAVTDVKLYQAVEVPLTSPSDIPIIAGKDAMVRVFYQVQAGYNGKPVTARFSAGSLYAETTQVLSGASSQANLASTANIKVPGKLLTVGGSFRVDLVQAEGSGTNSAAGFPQGTQQQPLGAQSSGQKLRIVLVPVINNGSAPDTSPAQLQRYLDQFRGQYPVPEIELTVRAQPYTYNGSLWGYGGWSDLLQEISELRQQDAPAKDVYYYGIHNAKSGGLLGLGWVAGANDVWSRAAIGVGWTGDTSAETAVHELGHNHGRPHSPCGVDGDWNYPHAGAKIGVWGYNIAKDKLLSPSSTVDFMSYCDPPWVSDHTYKALFKRLKSVNNAAIYIPAELKNRTWERVKILDGQATWLTPVTLEDPPRGEATPVTTTTTSGDAHVTGQLYGYDHLEGGILFLLRPADVADATSPLELAFSHHGKEYTVAR